MTLVQQAVAAGEYATTSEVIREALRELKLCRTCRADEDLTDIWLYIAADNPPTPDRLQECLDANCNILADNLRLGPARPDQP